MQSYLFIGDNNDGLTHPAPNDAQTLQWRGGVADQETYRRATLSMGAASIAVYVHESLTREEVLNRLVEHYRAWTVNRPGGR
jgi:hypothetical protein